MPEQLPIARGQRFLLSHLGSLKIDINQGIQLYTVGIRMREGFLARVKGEHKEPRSSLIPPVVVQLRATCLAHLPSLAGKCRFVPRSTIRLGREMHAAQGLVQPLEHLLRDLAQGLLARERPLFDAAKSGRRVRFDAAPVPLGLRLWHRPRAPQAAEARQLGARSHASQQRGGGSAT